MCLSFVVASTNQLSRTVSPEHERRIKSGYILTQEKQRVRSFFSHHKRRITAMGMIKSPI